MSYSIRRPTTTNEDRIAKQIGRILTSDMGISLDLVGYSIANQLPPIIFYRLETMFLAAKDEHDTIMGNPVETEQYGIHR
jgi:hypothetical protein